MDEYKLAPRDTKGLARAVQRFNQTRIKYLREHPETYASAARTLAWGIGDCDDQTILACATLRGAKVPCRAVFVGWAPAGAAGAIPFKHVFPEAWIDGRWVALEGVRSVPLGWDASAEKLKQGLRVRRATVGDKPGLVSDAAPEVRSA